MIECVVIGSRVEIVLDDDGEGRYWSVVEFVVKVMDQDWGVANTLLCRRCFFDFLSVVVVRVGSWPFFNKQNLAMCVCVF